MGFLSLPKNTFLAQNSFIYSNIKTYRFLMQLLYKGQYFKRFEKIIPYLKSAKKITELCFADTIIANYCKENNIIWVGYDLNEVFVTNAQLKKYNAYKADVLQLKNYEKADICLMIGSLYHFHENLELLLQKMFDAAPIIIVSEPVKNLSQSKGIIGKLAKASATVNGKEQAFRFTENSLLQQLSAFESKINFKTEVIERFNKDLIIRLTKI